MGRPVTSWQRSVLRRCLQIAYAVQHWHASAEIAIFSDTALYLFVLLLYYSQLNLLVLLINGVRQCRAAQDGCSRCRLHRAGSVVNGFAGYGRRAGLLPRPAGLVVLHVMTSLPRHAGASPKGRLPSMRHAKCGSHHSVPISASHSAPSTPCRTPRLRHACIIDASSVLLF